MPMMSPYQPVSPVGSPLFPIEPRASTLPAPRPPPRRPMSPGRSPHAALDFLTEYGREGAGQQLLSSDALGAATSVNRDRALSIRPLVQAQREEQQRNAMLEQVRKLEAQYAPAAVNKPPAPTWQSLGDWLTENYPQFSGKRIPKELGKRLRQEHMEQQAAKYQGYDTAMRGYGTQMRGRRQHVDPVEAAKLFAPKKEWMPKDVEAVRARHLATGDPVLGERLRKQRKAKETREDVLTVGEQKHELAKIEALRPPVPQPKTGKEVIARQLNADDYAGARKTRDFMRERGELDPAIASDDFGAALDALEKMQAVRLANPGRPPESELERDLAKMVKRYLSKSKASLTPVEIAKRFREGTLTEEQARRHAKSLGYGP